MKIRLPKYRFIRWAIYLGSPAILFLLSCLGMRWYTFRESAAELRAETERLDAEEPGWDWDSILKERKPIAETENGYRLIAEAISLSDPRSRFQAPILDLWRVLPEPMPVEVAEWAGEYVVDRKDAIRVARRLRDCPEGRLPITYAPGLISTIMDPIWHPAAVVDLLAWDARVNAQLGRFDDCIDELRAMRNAARSFRDEPFLISFTRRCSYELGVCRLTAEILSQGEASERGLAILQKEIAEEGRENYLLYVLKTERAGGLRTLQDYGEGDEPLRRAIPALQRNIGCGVAIDPEHSWEECRLMFAIAMNYPPVAKSDQAYFLRRMNEAVDAAKLVGPARLARFAELSRAYKSGSNFEMSRLLSLISEPEFDKAISADFHWQAAMRAAATGLAAERFRMAHKRWPNSLGELVPAYHDRVEEDPFTGKPLLFKKFSDGIAIYSVGKNGVDDGGDVNGRIKTGGRSRGNYDPAPPGDIGIRLWDVEKRGRSFQ